MCGVRHARPAAEHRALPVRRGGEALEHAIIDDVEDYFERGAGSTAAQYGGSYHNLAAWGFALADALRLTPERSRRAIDTEEGWIEDDFLGLPSDAMYRTVQKMFDPRQTAARSGDTPLRAPGALLERWTSPFLPRGAVDRCDGMRERSFAPLDSRACAVEAEREPAPQLLGRAMRSLLRACNDRIPRCVSARRVRLKAA